MFTRIRFNLVSLALAALAFTDNPGGEGTARAGETGMGTNVARAQFDPFCQWVNRHVKAGTFTIAYEGRNLKVDELLLDGRLRLLDGGTSIYAPFEGAIIDQLLPQIV
jgi:hypothetical protein